MELWLKTAAQEICSAMMVRCSVGYVLSLGNVSKNNYNWHSQHSEN